MQLEHPGTGAKTLREPAAGKQRTLQALRKSTAHGRKPSGAAKNLPNQPREQTSKLEPDMLTHPARAQNPEGKQQQKGKLRRHKVET